MRQVIQGKLYDTATAEQVHHWDNGHFSTDFKFREKTLYRTGKGNLFIHHIGGAMTDMAQPAGSNSYSGGESIEPINEQTAVRFLESHNGTDAILKHFPDHVDEA